MTQEHKSAVDVAAEIVEKFMDTGRFRTSPGLPSELVWDSQDVRFEELEKEITQAIENSDKTSVYYWWSMTEEVSDENLALRVDNERLRGNFMALRDRLDDKCHCYGWLEQALSDIPQPTPTGISNEILRFATKAYAFHEHLTDCKVIMGDDDEFRQAAENLSSETKVLLEGLDNAIFNA